MPKHDVLISYSTQDQALAQRVVRTLTARGIRCWAAFQDLETGQFWPGAITEAINDCSIFVLLLTKHSNASRQVTRELTQADTLNKLLYCVQTEDLSISPNVQYFFSAVQRYEAFQVDLDTSLARMADDILRQLQRLDPVERPAAPTDPISSSKRRSSTVARTIRMSAAVVGSLVLGIMVTLVVNQSRSDRPDHPLPSSTGTGKAADPPRPTDISGSKIPDPGGSGKTAGGSKAPDSTVTSSAPVAPNRVDSTAPVASKRVDAPAGRAMSAKERESSKAAPSSRSIDVITDFTLSIDRVGYFSSKPFEVADLDLRRDFLIAFDVKSTRPGGSTRYGVAWNLQEDDFLLFTIHSIGPGGYSIGAGRSRTYTPFSRFSQGGVAINAESQFDRLQMEKQGDALVFRINGREVWRTSTYKLESNRFAFWAADSSDAVMKSYTVRQE